jgi:predicted RecB family endonuclease
MPETTNAVPSSMRRLDTASANRLVRLVEAFDDLQTVLSCCERLVPKLARTAGELDDVGIEALWTLALLSYARSFAEKDGEVVLTVDDLSGKQAPDELQRWHQVLLRLRDHHAALDVNPREVYSVGVVQDEDGAVNAVAVTSVRAPSVDEASVRQAGAMAYPLCAVLDERINALQKSILDEVRDTSKTALDAMDLIEVVTAS